jgi:lysophospholipase L1-like esterase
VIAASLTGTTIEAPKPERPDPLVPLFDYTHLGEKGAQFFAAMVTEELRLLPEFRTLLQSPQH